LLGQRVLRPRDKHRALACGARLLIKYKKPADGPTFWAESAGYLVSARGGRLLARCHPAHQWGSQPGDALAHGLAAIVGGYLGVASASTRQARLQNAEGEPEQDTGKHDID